MFTVFTVKSSYITLQQHCITLPIPFAAPNSGEGSQGNPVFGSWHLGLGMLLVPDLREQPSFDREREHIPKPLHHLYSWDFDKHPHTSAHKAHPSTTLACHGLCGGISFGCDPAEKSFSSETAPWAFRIFTLRLVRLVRVLWDFQWKPKGVANASIHLISGSWLLGD